MLQHGHCALYLFPTLNAFALTGRIIVCITYPRVLPWCYAQFAQGVASLALGWAQFALSGRIIVCITYYLLPITYYLLLSTHQECNT